MKPEKKTIGLNRRNFIKAAAMGVGGTALATLGSKTTVAAKVPDKWDKEADVVVIGFGGAGAAAAIEAHDAAIGILHPIPEPRLIGEDVVHSLDALYFPSIRHW